MLLSFPRPWAHGGWSPFVLFSFLYSLGSPKDRLNKWFPLQPSTPGMAIMIHTRKAEARRFRNQSGYTVRPWQKQTKKQCWTGYVAQKASVNLGVSSQHCRNRAWQLMPVILARRNGVWQLMPVILALQKWGVATHAYNLSTAETGRGNSYL